jgi:hypothetical protein
MHDARAQQHPSFEWRPAPGQGHGVCARRSFPAGALIDCVPIASDSPVSPAAMYCAGDDWSPANVELRGGPTPDTAAVHALRDISAGEELMVQHGQFVLLAR